MDFSDADFRNYEARWRHLNSLEIGNKIVFTMDVYPYFIYLSRPKVPNINGASSALNGINPGGLSKFPIIPFEAKWNEALNQKNRNP